MHTPKQVMNFMKKTSSSREDEEKNQPPPNKLSFPRRDGWLPDGHSQVGEPSKNDEEEGGVMTAETEYMFDKVVTPSDVGRLNRIVIPKQEAERYFPLASSMNEKGVLLNFEDRNGKMWWFRYSYWKSSQSYVMTKGWRRFVKEKNVHARDVVSFHRGVGVTDKYRLFIDLRRRVTALSQPKQLSSFSLPHHNLVLKSYPMPPPPNINLSLVLNSYPILPMPLTPNSNPSSYTTNGYGTPQQHFEMTRPPTPQLHGKTSGKGIRLFGVNMYYPLSEDEHHDQNYDTPSESSHAIVGAASSIINPFSMGPFKYHDGLSLKPPVIPQSSSSITTIL